MVILNNEKFLYSFKQNYENLKIGSIRETIVNIKGKYRGV